MLTKYASFQVLSATMAPTNIGRRGLHRWAHKHGFNYNPRPGMLYVRSRAISSRCNDNFDEFPAEEIKKAYKTFIGKPVFVNHANENHRRSRGVVIDAALHEDRNPDGSPDTWAEVLMEVDAVNFPKLAKAIIARFIDRTSMGTDVAFSVCSFCNNKATNPAEYCAHIPRMKGQRIYRTTAAGTKEGILVREICYGLGFFENSLLVEEPADPTAYFLGIETAPGVTAKKKGFPKTQKCKYCDSQATKRVIHSEGMAYIPACDTHLDKAKDAAARCTPDGSHDPSNIDYVRDIPKAASIRHTVDATRIYHPDKPHEAWEDVPSTTKCNGPGCRRRVKTDSDKWAMNWAQDTDDNGNIYDYCSDACWDAHHKANADLFTNDLYTKGVRHTGASKSAFKQFVLAYGETMAPADVDTLRDEECPVCGDANSYDGNECQVCGYVAPPEMFQDPDLDLARSLDLRKDVADEAGTDPNGDGMPDVIPGSGVPGTDRVPMDANEIPDPDNVAQEQVNQITEDQEPLDPGNLGPNGEPLPDPAETLDPEVQRGLEGQPVDPDAVAPDGQVYSEPDGEPGTPGDGTPDLVCDNCGSSFDAAPPTSINMSDPGAGPDGAVAGDMCPNCGQGVLLDAESLMNMQDSAAPVQAAASAQKGWKTSARDSRRGHSQPEGVTSMASRPALAALAAQQKQISLLSQQNEFLRAQLRVANRQIAFIGKMAGLTSHLAAIKKKADEDNPSSPIPDPAAEQPFETTEEALAPDAVDNVQSPGETPGSVEDLPADDTTMPLVPGEDMPEEPFNELQDVTAPVAGTEEQLPLDQTKIETDVRVGDPTDPEVAFPWTLSSNRTMASIRLAKLRLAARTAKGDELTIAAQIENDRNLSDQMISHEISTLAAVVKSASRPNGKNGTRPAHLVPKAAGVQRTVASLSSDAALISTAGVLGGDDIADSDLFD